MRRHLPGSAPLYSVNSNGPSGGSSTLLPERKRHGVQPLFNVTVREGQSWSIVHGTWWSAQSSQRYTRNGTRWQERPPSAMGHYSKTLGTWQPHQPLVLSWTVHMSHHQDWMLLLLICLERSRRFESWCRQIQHHLSLLQSNGSNIGELSMRKHHPLLPASIWALHHWLQLRDDITLPCRPRHSYSGTRDPIGTVVPRPISNTGEDSWRHSHHKTMRTTTHGRRL
jgi:hypothetical protein